MQPFSQQEFNTWKNELNDREKENKQTEKVNRRSSYYYHSDTGKRHVDDKSTKYHPRDRYLDETYIPRDSKLNAYTIPRDSKLNAYTIPRDSKLNEYTIPGDSGYEQQYYYSPHQDIDTHSDYISGGGHQDTPGTGHSDQGGDSGSYSVHVDTPAKYHGDHRDIPASYHGDHRDIPAKYHGDHRDIPAFYHGDHRDIPAYTTEMHSDIKSTHRDTSPHSDSGFNHNDFVPSIPQLFIKED